MGQEKTGFGMQWQLASAGPYANNLHLAPTTQTPRHSITGRMLFLTLNQQCQSTEGEVSDT